MKYNNLNYLTVFVLSSILFFVFPFMSDDWKFSEANSVGDCIDLTISFYNHWNGRIIPNFAGFFLLSLVPNWVYALITGAIYTCFVWLVMKLCGNKVGIFLVVILTLLLPSPVECYLWRIGNVNYLYAAVFMLLSIWVFDKDRTSGVKQLLLSALLGILTGITHEAVSLPLLGGFIFYLIVNRKVGKHQWVLLIGLSVGTLFNVLCPGTFVRSGLLQDAASFNVLKCLFSEIICAWFSIACLVAMIVAYRRRTLGEILLTNKLYVILWIVNICFVFALACKSVSVAGRVLFFQELCALLLFVKIISALGINLKGKVFSSVALVLSIAIFVCCVVTSHRKSLAVNAELSDIETTTDSIVRANVLPLSINSNDPSNTTFCRIYKKKTLHALKSPIYEDLYKNGALDESRKVVFGESVWYNYDQTFIRELGASDSFDECEYESVPFISFAPAVVNQKLSQFRKKATIPVDILPSKNGKKRFVIADVAGQSSVKKVVSINLK